MAGRDRRETMGVVQEDRLVFIRITETSQQRDSRARGAQFTNAHMRGDAGIRRSGGFDCCTLGDPDQDLLPDFSQTISGDAARA